MRTLEVAKNIEMGSDGTRESFRASSATGIPARRRDA